MITLVPYETYTDDSQVLLEVDIGHIEGDIWTARVVPLKLLILSSPDIPKCLPIGTEIQWYSRAQAGTLELAMRSSLTDGSQHTQSQGQPQMSERDNVVNCLGVNPRTTLS